MAVKLSHKQGRELVEQKILTEEAFAAMVKAGSISAGMASGKVWVAEDEDGIEVIPKFSFECVIPQGKGFRTKLNKNLSDFTRALDKLFEKHFEEKDTKYVREQRGANDTAPDVKSEDPDGF